MWVLCVLLIQDEVSSFARLSCCWVHTIVLIYIFLLFLSDDNTNMKFDCSSWIPCWPAGISKPASCRWNHYSMISMTKKQTKHKSKAAAMLWDWLYWQLKWEKVDARKRSASICHHIQMGCNSCIYARTSPKCLHHHLHTFVFELQSKLRARHLHRHYTRYSLIWKLLDQEQSILSSCRMFQMLVWNTRKQTDSHFSVNGI